MILTMIITFKDDFDHDYQIENEFDITFKDDFPEQTVNSYLVWGGIAIHYADQYSKVELFEFH